MRRSFLSGVCIGGFVFVQSLLIFRLPVRVAAVQLWALAWSGVFGLLLGYSPYTNRSQGPPPLTFRIHYSIFANTSEALQSFIVAAAGLMLFYGVAAFLTRCSYRMFRWTGVVCATVAILLVHIGLYLLFIKSVVA